MIDVKKDQLKLKRRKMTRKYAVEILNWRYPAPYDMYNSEESEAEIQEFLTGGYRAIVNRDGFLVGSYCSKEAAQVPKGHEFGVYEGDYLDIGLGMNPELTGQGFGKVFFAFILKQFKKNSLRLTVATFNHRAIRLYQGFGFTEVAKFMNGDVEFMVMIQDAKIQLGKPIGMSE